MRTPQGAPPAPSPQDLLRLCSKDDQLFISGMARVPRPPPRPSAQATGGALDRLHAPTVGSAAPAMSRRREIATILFPFNSASVAPARSSSPSPSPRAGPEFGELCFSLPSLLLPPCT